MYDAGIASRKRLIDDEEEKVNLAVRLRCEGQSCAAIRQRLGKANSSVRAAILMHSGQQKDHDV